MADQNLVLYVASYSTVQAAEADFAEMKQAEAAGTIAITGAAVMSRAKDGEITVDESGLGSSVSTGAKVGAGAGLVLGLLAPPLLIATAIGAGLGALTGELTKKHKEKELGLVFEEYLKPGSAAIAAVFDDQYADAAKTALGNATKATKRPVDSDDIEKLKKALSWGGGDAANVDGAGFKS
jgi:uncharacterized membrane protein